ncbi:MAG TPA: non-heme iron oxygenase ferredoxin subunit [Arenicellales bacterium]|jgi:3-phenylpropionate/trans-cinnamate dioxygenase ferredoxin subunit|nr:non-heme iron oxygenase ferredoxin subunit [Arenicellales bacterium]|tara:strand:- start:14 stop:334 length:321 start_codon:yes stop_codon:yes gene_type:complete
MDRWVNVAPEEELHPGNHQVVEIDGALIAVFNIDGQFFAIEDVCTHDGGELACGEVDGDVIICPRHGARFSLATGEVLSPPAYEGVATFPVRVEGGIVQTRDPRWD